MSAVERKRILVPYDGCPTIVSREAYGVGPTAAKLSLRCRHILGDIHHRSSSYKPSARPPRSSCAHSQAPAVALTLECEGAEKAVLGAPSLCQTFPTSPRASPSRRRSATCWAMPPAASGAAGVQLLVSSAVRAALRSTRAPSAWHHRLPAPPCGTPAQGAAARGRQLVGGGAAAAGGVPVLARLPPPASRLWREASTSWGVEALVLRVTVRAARLSGPRTPCIGGWAETCHSQSEC